MQQDYQNQQDSNHLRRPIQNKAQRNIRSDHLNLPGQQFNQQKYNNEPIYPNGQSNEVLKQRLNYNKSLQQRQDFPRPSSSNDTESTAPTQASSSNGKSSNITAPQPNQFRATHLSNRSPQNYQGHSLTRNSNISNNWDGQSSLQSIDRSQRTGTSSNNNSKNTGKSSNNNSKRSFNSRGKMLPGEFIFPTVDPSLNKSRLLLEKLKDFQSLNQNPKNELTRREHQQKRPLLSPNRQINYQKQDQFSQAPTNFTDMGPPPTKAPRFEAPPSNTALFRPQHQQFRQMQNNRLNQTSMGMNSSVSRIQQIHAQQRPHQMSYTKQEQHGVDIRSLTKAANIQKPSALIQHPNYNSTQAPQQAGHIELLKLNTASKILEYAKVSDIDIIMKNFQTIRDQKLIEEQSQKISLQKQQEDDARQREEYEKSHEYKMKKEWQIQFMQPQNIPQNDEGTRTLQERQRLDQEKQRVFQKTKFVAVKKLQSDIITNKPRMKNEQVKITIKKRQKKKEEKQIKKVQEKQKGSEYLKELQKETREQKKVSKSSSKIQAIDSSQKNKIEIEEINEKIKEVKKYEDIINQAGKNGLTKGQISALRAANRSRKKRVKKKQNWVYNMDLIGKRNQNCMDLFNACLDKVKFQEQDSYSKILNDFKISTEDPDFDENLLIKEEGPIKQNDEIQQPEMQQDEKMADENEREVENQYLSQV